jgi:hypothetical protein
MLKTSRKIDGQSDEGKGDPDLDISDDDESAELVKQIFQPS